MNSLEFSFILILNLLMGSCWAVCRGCIELDELTFEKLIKRYPVALVKFDIAYPYGDKHEAFAEFALDVAENVDNLLVAVVGIKDYGEKDNANLGKKFAVRDVYPDIKLFVNGNVDKWFDYPAGIDIKPENLKNFVRQYSGMYIGLPGCLKDFDRIAQNFIQNLKNNTQSVASIEQTVNIIDSLIDDKNKNTAQIYLMIMRRVIEKGDSFIQIEKKRVNKLLTGKLTETKRKELYLRLNILQAFALVPPITFKSEL